MSNPSNEYFLLGFNTKPELLADWTSDQDTIIDSFNDLNVYGNTAFYDASYVAIDKLQRGHHAKRALILISDGQDNLSHYTFNEVLEALKKAGILLYAVSFPGDADDGSALGRDSLDLLDELSSLSGGIAISKKDGAPLKLKHATSVFEMIANELRHQYTISIMPDESGDNKKWRQLKVKVKTPTDAPHTLKSIRVRTRTGFYHSHALD